MLGVSQCVQALHTTWYDYINRLTAAVAARSLRCPKINVKLRNRDRLWRLKRAESRHEAPKEPRHL